jgi:UDP-N-acetylmuramate--alanine ligase
LGGITQNYQTNFLLNDPTDQLNEVICVVEADEFDRSFLTLYPDIAVVTSTDADHLDIYGQHSQLLDSFEMYISQIKSTGKLFLREGLTIGQNLKVPKQSYSFESGDFYAHNFRIENATFVFDLVYPAGVVKDVFLQMPGFHNVENALAAFACAWTVGVQPEQIKLALASYKGVKRRFEYHHKGQKHIQIDDYAHHPTEIEAFLKSVRALYPDRHITAIFQPHLFTRTQDFQEGFAESLSLADRLMLLDIYPARELPIHGVTSAIILDKVTISDKKIYSKDEIMNALVGLDLDVVCTIGAGDIDLLIEPIKAMLIAQK